MQETLNVVGQQKPRQDKSTLLQPHRHGQIVTDLQLLDLPLEAHSLIVKSISTDIGHPAEPSLHLAHDSLPAPQAHVSKRCDCREVNGL